MGVPMTDAHAHPAPAEPAGRPADAAALRARLLEVVRVRGYTQSAEPFRLSSGGTSHDYVDLRRAFSRGEDLATAAEAVAAHLAEAGIAFDAIGGLTMGADPIAHAVALLTRTSWFSVRKAEKTHGSRRRIEGAVLGPGVRVVCVEDTTSTGRSLLEAVEVARDSGATVLAACALLDRGEAAAPLVAARAVPYTSVLSYRDLGIAPIGGDGDASEGSARA